MKKRFHKEVEIKAKVSDFKKILLKLEKIGATFSKAILQRDINYLSPENTFPVITPGCAVLRIREEGRKVHLTYKQAVLNELDRIEREVEIKDKRVMEEIIEYLGFTKSTEVIKKRTKIKHKDFIICLDEVKDLGNFIEIEKMTNERDGEKVQEELVVFLESLGVDRKERVLQGYDTLIYEKLNS